MAGDSNARSMFVGYRVKHKFPGHEVPEEQTRAPSTPARWHRGGAVRARKLVAAPHHATHSPDTRHFPCEGHGSLTPPVHAKFEASRFRHDRVNASTEGEV